MALMPIQDRVGDTRLVRTAFELLQTELRRRGTLIDAAATRDAARRVRLRNADSASPDALHRLGAELGAEWIVSVTVHEAVRAAMSTRVLEAETGDLYWAGFEAASGLDRRGLLDLGVVSDLETLLRRVTATLLEDLPAVGHPVAKSAKPGKIDASRVGRVALVPLAGLAKYGATVSAEAVTEAVRATAFRYGMQLLSPNGVSRALRRGRAVWGEVDEPTRVALRAGSGSDPKPQVRVALRLVDARTGHLLWSKGIERDGADRPRLFKTGRIYSGGVLSRRVVESLLQQILLQAGRGDTG
jgi:TolB-like protein